MSPDDLSPRQNAILEFIRSYTGENGYPPSIREIGAAAEISSTSVVNYNLNVLQEKHYIERQKEISRGLRLVDRGRAPTAEPTFRIPLLGRIAAGEPIPVPDSNFATFDEVISLTRDVIKDPQGVYALQVKGNSMIDALINDGDIVIMRHQQKAENGEMVAAWLRDEKETTLKRFYWEDQGHTVRLQPANPAFEPIYVPSSNVEIQGKVIAVVRQLA